MRSGVQITVRSVLRSRFRSAMDSLLDFWMAHPFIDIALSVFIVIGHLISSRYYPFLDLMSSMVIESRMSLYSAGAGVVALISGFAGMAIALYGSSSGDLVEAIRRRHGSKIRKNWISISLWLLFSAAIFLFCMILDQDKEANWARWVFEAIAVMAATKFFRLVSIFNLVLLAGDRQIQQPPSPTIPRPLD